VDLTRVAVSTIPRHEAPADCLMTAVYGRSGQSAALAHGPGMIFGWRRYSFSRLTCHSNADCLNRQTVHGSPGGSGSEVDPALLSMLGTFPLSVDSTSRFHDSLALDVPVFALSPSTTPIVDSAGWTEVVIQEGSFPPSDFIIGRKAKVDASFNIDKETTPPKGRSARRIRQLLSDNCTCGCPGRSVMSDNSISCLSFNEVTK
jgi:hypothetical protein